MNVFLVTSPFQYICANEARLAYKANNNILILIEQDNPVGIKQMDAMLEEKNWDHVLRFPRNRRTTVTPQIIKSVKRLCNGSLSTLYYSEYNAWRTKLIMKNLVFEKHVFFDDGTMTFFDYYDHIEPKKKYKRNRWFQDTLLHIQGVKPIGEIGFFENTEIFSIFSIPDCIVQYKENGLQELQSIANNIHCNLKQTDVFIGQGCIDEKGHASLDEYKDQVLHALSNNSSLLYIPHRTEAKHVSDTIRSLKGIKYHYPKYPIEIELVKCGYKPNNIFGLTSTALYTLSKIYPDSQIQLITQPKHVGDSANRVQRYLYDYFLDRV